MFECGHKKVSLKSNILNILSHENVWSYVLLIKYFMQQHQQKKKPSAYIFCTSTIDRDNL